MLTLNNLKKSYDQTSILNGISLSIETGGNRFHSGTERKRKNNPAELYTGHYRN